MWVLLIALGAIVVLALIASIASSLATNNQAQAAVEAARAAQIAAQGQRESTLAIVLLVVLLFLILIAAGALVIYLVRRDRRREQRMQELSLMQGQGMVPVQDHYRGLASGKPYSVQSYTRQLGAGQAVDPLQAMIGLALIRYLDNNNTGSGTTRNDSNQDPWGWS